MARAKFNLPANKSHYLLAIEGQPWAVTRFELFEALNTPGELRIDLVHPNASLELEDMIGKKAVFSMPVGTSEGAIEKTRNFIGIIREFEILGTDQKAAFYRASIVPRIWKLSLKHRSRVFATDSADGWTVFDAIRSVMSDHGLRDNFSFKRAGDKAKYSFLNQYQETDLDYLHRLIEEEGIGYYVREDDGNPEIDHVVFFDGTADLEDCFPFDTVLVRKSSGALKDDLEVIEEMTLKRRMNFDQVEVRDYNFKESQRRLKGSKGPSGKNRFNEYYQAAGKFQDQDDARGRMTELSRLRSEEFQTGAVIASGFGSYRSMRPGFKFKTEGHSLDSMNREWICTSVIQSGTDAEHADTSGAPMGAGGVSYGMRFTCIPSDVPYRPARVTPKPVIRGTQTAIVCGPPNEEIFTDKFGRVKVHMHWDRQPENDRDRSESKKLKPHEYDDKSSFWVRVSQLAAGKSWGIFSLPRVGQEVVIDFIEGDPDQPIVTGVVHNDFQTVPYTLPDHKTRTTIKTNSSPGGDGFNELRFEDKKGHEQIFMHAQRNMDIRVIASCMEAIGGSRHLIVGNQKDGGDQKERVFGNQDIEVFKNREEQIHEDHKLTVNGNQHVNVDGDHFLNVNGSAHLAPSSEFRVQIGGKHSLSVNADRHTSITGDDLKGVTGGCHITANEIVLSATKGITIAVGANFIVIDPSGVSIQGMKVMVNSGGMPTPPTPAMPDPAKIALLAHPEEPAAADNDKTGKKSLLPSPPK